jgi:hypothetical protein
MKLKSLAVSPPLFLRDLSDEFKKREDAEGEILESDRTNVIVRQATEADNIARAELQAKRQMQWGAGAISEIVEDNPRQRMMYEAHWTLVEVRNLTWEDGSPVFPADKPIHKMPFPDFEKIWGGLESYITLALHKAVLKINKDWDWSGEA